MGPGLQFCANLLERGPWRCAGLLDPQDSILSGDVHVCLSESIGATADYDEGFWEKLIYIVIIYKIVSKEAFIQKTGLEKRTI